MTVAARENEIGRCRCPVCSSDRARLRVNTKGLAYVVCDACNVQVFARSDRSDGHLRRMHLPEPASAPPAPAAATAAAPAPEPAPPTIKADRPGMTWGAFSWIK